MGYVNKEDWFVDQRGYGIGRLSYLIAMFEGNNGSYYVEFDTARDVTVNYSRQSVDTNCWRSVDMKEYVMGKCELSVSAELLFDLFDSASTGLMWRIMSGEYFRLGAFTDMGFGPWFWSFGTKFDRSEPLDDIIKVNIEFPCARFLYWYDTCFDIANGIPTGLRSSHPLVASGIVSKLPQLEKPVKNKKRTFTGTLASSLD